MASSQASPAGRLHRKTARFHRDKEHPRGLAQLSLVEHALCPLAAAESLKSSHVFETAYSYSNANRHRRRAKVRVTCPEGLSASDEFYLWGLLSLAFSQRKPAIDFYATPYYCLRQLGCIDAGAKRGGKNYELFRNALRRLAAVSYFNSAFYDPLRREHRDVAFGFLSYSLPLDPTSSRAWRFAWDPIFFEFCSASAGALVFDLATYRELDPASRRLFLLLRKIFWRSDHSPTFTLRDLAVDVLGFSPTHETWRLKQKLALCVDRLLRLEVIRLPETVGAAQELFQKRSKGEYAVCFHRGRHFDESATLRGSSELTDSPLCEPLRAVGLDDAAIRRVLSRYSHRLIAEISDMTLAAGEKFGTSFFKASPQAYFIDNLKAQAARTRTPPDWWREIRKAEERKQWNASTAPELDDEESENEFDAYLESDARDAFDRVMQRVFADFRAAGQSDVEARENARHHARTHLRHRFDASRCGAARGPVDTANSDL